MARPPRDLRVVGSGVPGPGEVALLSNRYLRVGVIPSWEGDQLLSWGIYRDPRGRETSCAHLGHGGGVLRGLGDQLLAQAFQFRRQVGRLQFRRGHDPRGTLQELLQCRALKGQAEWLRGATL